MISRIAGTPLPKPTTQLRAAFGRLDEKTVNIYHLAHRMDQENLNDLAAGSLAGILFGRSVPLRSIVNALADIARQKTYDAEVTESIQSHTWLSRPLVRAVYVTTRNSTLQKSNDGVAQALSAKTDNVDETVVQKHLTDLNELNCKLTPQNWNALVSQYSQQFSPETTRLAVLCQPQESTPSIKA